MPAFPLLGALPGQAANPAVLVWAVLTLIGAGVATHVALVQARVQRMLLSTAVAAGAAGVLMAVLAWLAGGAVGERRLRTVGASPWQVGLLSTGEILLVALLAIPADWLWRWWHGRRQPRRIAEPVAQADEQPEEVLSS